MELYHGQEGKVREELNLSVDFTLINEFPGLKALNELVRWLRVLPCKKLACLCGVPAFSGPVVDIRGALRQGCTLKFK
ncbi:MAG: hypothetical protein N2645_14510 [Clostridia bacterium]|nr:hypothetical protein [Clostridia bacterium]